MRILQCVTCEERCMGLLTVKVVAARRRSPEPVRVRSVDDG